MEFNITRFKNLILRDIMIYKKPLLLGASLMMIFLLLVTGLNLYNNNPHPGPFIIQWFITYTLFGGLLLTSVIFWEFRSAAGRLQYLSLPASHFEKLLSRWIYTMIIYPLFVFLFFVFVYLVLYNFVAVGLGWGWEMVAETYMSYWIVHPLVFMFAVWYNKYSAPKAVLTCLGVALGIVLVFYISQRLIFSELFEGFMMTNKYSIEPSSEFQFFVEGNVEYVAKFFGLIVMPIFFWVVAFFKMKEKEA